MGRRSRFDEVAMPHLPALYRLARHLAGADKADDLVQDTYLRAWKSFDQFTSGTNCRAWLCQILRNVWITDWRRTRLELPVSDMDTVRAELRYDWEGMRLAGHLSADMQWALEQLPDQYRWAVLLNDVEELTYQEIARVMDCPIGTVMSRINRGRRMLAQLLLSRRAARPAPAAFKVVR